LLQQSDGKKLLRFGLKWLKNAIMRYAGLKAHHDEQAVYTEFRNFQKGRRTTDGYLRESTL
jgi:uncharacterized membrane protein